MKDYSKQNLDVTHYRNGEPIPFVEDKEEWSKLTTGAYCYYDNDPEKGILYNWYAVNDSRGLAPKGWKIPSITELSQIDLTTGLPGGYRYYIGYYNVIGTFGNWWSSTEYNTNDAWYRYLYNVNGNAFRDYYSKKNGLSVRCLRDLIENITLGGCNYVYFQHENEYQLFYHSEDISWREDLRGKLATKIIDTGNGLIIIQDKKNRLDYSEASEIKFLLNKINI